ncbi:MAG TPA: DUF58 domain-containing protein [Chloroflexota bacterium]|nr:DUF58 domain-containing protein [Chloroflexota bacterium]
MVSLIPLALALFVLASFLKISFIYTLSYLVAGMYLLATFWSQRNASDLVCRRDYADRALLGDDVKVTLEIENKGILPVPWLQLEERLPLALASPPYYRVLVAVGPRATRKFTYILSCRQRGWYSVGPLKARVGDILGLSVRETEYAAARHLTVYPEIFALDELGFPSKSPFGTLRTQQILYEDPSRVVGVREYQSGDSLRRINWKASASSGRLQVRKLEPAMTLQTVILLNVNLPDFERQRAYTEAEFAISVAASLANHLVDMRQEVGLLTNGSDPAEPSEVVGLRGLLPRKGRGQLTNLLELLGRLELAHERPFWGLVRAEAQRLPWGATLVFVTSQETSDLLDTVMTLQRSGFNIVLVYVDYPNPESGELALRRAATLGLRAYRVARASDLSVWKRQTVGTGV